MKNLNRPHRKLFSDRLSPKNEERRSWWKKILEPSVLISLTSSILAVVAVSVSYVGMRVSQNAATATRVEFSQLNRPWVEVAVASVGDIEVNSEGAQLYVEFNLQNTGNTPAVEVELYVVGGVQIQGPGPRIRPMNVLPHLEAISEKFKGGMTTNIKGVLFPRNVVKQRHAIILSLAELDRVKSSGITISMFGLVDYSSPLGGMTHRQTKFQYTIARGIGQGRMASWIGLSKTIPNEEIVVFESGTGGFYAN